MCCASVLVVTLTSVAFADDLLPAPWRTTPPGQPPTTLQAWQFSAPTNPSPPDVVFNSFGNPLATVHYTTPFTPWLPEDHGHFGVWYVEDWISFELPNQPDPNLQKLLWVQVTFSSVGGQDPLFFTNPPLASVEIVRRVPLDQYYWHGTYLIKIQPNPPMETLYIAPRECAINIDQVVIDTICIPEPGTLALLAVCGLFRRR